MMLISQLQKFGDPQPGFLHLGTNVGKRPDIDELMCHNVS